MRMETTGFGREPALLRALASATEAASIADVQRLKLIPQELPLVQEAHKAGRPEAD